MSFFDLFRSKKSNVSHLESTIGKPTCDPQLEYALDLFFSFADKNKSKIVRIFISPAQSISDSVAFDLTFLLDGKVVWYQSDETKDLFDLFKQIDDDSFCKVQYTLNTYEKSSGYEETVEKLKAYILSYMQKHPERQFTMQSYGVTMTIWDE